MDSSSKEPEILKGLTAWQVKACEIAKAIKYLDERDFPVYLIRKIHGLAVSEDMSWHPDYDEYREEPFLKNYLSFDYYDDRTVQLLFDAKVLLKKETTVYPVIDHTSEMMGIEVDSKPAGYVSVPNWEAIDSHQTNLRQLLSGKSKPSYLQSLANEFTIKVMDGNTCLVRGDKQIYRFRSSNYRGFLYFEYCLNNFANKVALKSLFEYATVKGGFNESYPEVGYTNINKNITQLLKKVVYKINSNLKDYPYEFNLVFSHGATLTLVKKS